MNLEFGRQFTEQIELLKTVRGLKQVALAEQAGVSEGLLSRMKGGHVPGHDSLARVCSIFPEPTKSNLLRLGSAGKRDSSSPASLGDGAFHRDFYLQQFDWTIYYRDDLATTDEVSTIIAKNDGLDRVKIPRYIPHNSLEGQASIPHPTALENARIEGVEAKAHDWFLITVRFPHALSASESIRFRLQTTVRAEALQPFVYHAPIENTGLFRLRLQFDTTRAPERVQIVNAEPSDLARSVTMDGRPEMQPTEFGLVEIPPFEPAIGGLTYGAVWEWGDA